MSSPKIKIFVLSLKGNSLRRKKLTKTLDEMNLPYQIWLGIDGRKILPLKYENKIDRIATKKNLFREMTDAEYACALSHNEIYHEIVKQDLFGAVIIDEDAVLDYGFKNLFTYFSKVTCDMLLLDHHSGRVSLKRKYLISPNYIGYKVYYPPYLTTGYYINFKAAKKMIEKSGKISNVADWPCDITSLNCAAIMPRVMHQSKKFNNSSGIRDKRNKMKPIHNYKRFIRFDYWRKKYLKMKYTKLS